MVYLGRTEPRGSPLKLADWRRDAQNLGLNIRHPRRQDFSLTWQTFEVEQF